MPQLFHKDVGIPLALTAGPSPSLRLRFSHHSHVQASRKDITLPEVMPGKYELIEVEASKGRAIKWVIRTSNPVRPIWDVVMVILLDGFVKTVWLNHRLDRHATLNKTPFTLPKDFDEHVA
jgi:hypothetical protein